MRGGQVISHVDMGHIVALSALALILCLASYTELRDNRIPNALTLGGIGAGFILGYLPGGITLGSSLGGFLIGFGFLFIFYMVGGMGGGDVKLMGAVGALFGHQLIQPTLVYTAIVGGIMAIFAVIWKPGNLRFIRNWRQDCAGGNNDADEQESCKTDKHDTATEENGLGTIPYGLAIVVGSIMTIFLSAG